MSKYLQKDYAQDLWTGTVSIDAPGQKPIVLNTNDKYVDSDIALNISVPYGSATVSGSAQVPIDVSIDEGSGDIYVDVGETIYVTPTVTAGYITSGTRGSISVSGSRTISLDIATVAETMAYLGIS